MTRHADCTTPQRAAPGHDLACVTRADHDPLDGFALRRGGWDDWPATWNPEQAAPTARLRDRASGWWMKSTNSPCPCGAERKRGRARRPHSKDWPGPP